VLFSVGEEQQQQQIFASDDSNFGLFDLLMFTYLLYLNMIKTHILGHNN